MNRFLRIQEQAPELRPAGIVALYAIVALLWALLSDQLFLAAVGDPNALLQWGIFKDLIFAAGTTGMLYVLMRRWERSLQENLDRFRDLTDASSDWIWAMDQHLRFTYLSDRHYALTGVPSQELIGHTRWELAADETDDDEKWLKHRETLDLHLPFRDFTYQTRIADAKGKRHYFKVSGKPVYDERARFKGYRGTGTDITDQVEAEHALLESQRMLATLMANLPGMAYRGRVDPDWSMEFVSTGALQLTGYRPEQITGDGEIRYRQLIVPEDRERVRETVQYALAGRKPYELLYRIDTASGEEKWVWEQGCGVFSAQGRLLAIEGFATDVTEQKRAEQEMRRMRFYLENIIDSMPSALVGVEADGTITEWNREAERLTGRGREKAMGTNFAEAFPKLAGHLAKVQQAIAQRTPLKTERLVSEHDGEPHYTDVMVYPLVTDGASGAVIRLDDVTARVRIEQMMVQTEKMMSIGGLAAGMAHEINNPLGAILQGCQNVTRRFSPDLEKNHEVAQHIGVDFDKLRAYLEQREILHFLRGIQEAGIRASKIVTDMLGFSRRSERNFAPASVREMVDTALRLAMSDYDLKKRYDFKQIDIVCELDPEAGEIVCDKTEIEQVLLNLLRNAAQAMADGPQTEKPRIIVRVQREGEAVRIEVADNGPGMQEATRKRIFEPFFTTKEVGVGTGLGLSVSYFIIADQHKGFMNVESSPGHGARFIIRLPAKPVHA